jgi:hypothetical protein
VNNPRSRPLLSLLPNVFRTPGGSIDAGLLQRIFHEALVPRPSKKVKQLLARWGKRKNRDPVRPFDLLSLEIEDPEFRAVWYRTAYETRVDLPPLFALIDTRAKLLNSELSIAEGPIAAAFQKRNERYYPKLNALEPLIDGLLRAAETNEQDAALYAWSLIEHSKWRSQFEATDNSLQGFEAALHMGLQMKAAQGVLTLLSRNDKPPPSNVARSTRPVVIGEDLTSDELDSLLHAHTTERDLQIVKADELGIRLEAVREAWRTFTTRLEAVTKGIETQTPRNAVQRLNDGLDGLRTDISTLDQLGATALQRTVNRLETIVETLAPLDVKVPKAPQISELGIEKWTTETVALVKLVDEISNAAQPLAALPVDLRHKAAQKLGIESAQLMDLASYCDDLSEETQLLSLTEQSNSALRAKIEVEWSNFSWNPFVSSDLPADIFVILGRQLIADDSHRPLAFSSGKISPSWSMTLLRS